MSDLYAKIETTIRSFVESTHVSPDKPYSDATLPGISSFRTPDALHSWRPNYYVASNPQLPKGKVDNQTFLGSLAVFLPAVDAFEPKIHNIVIDTRTLQSTVQVSVFLKTKGSEVALENDLVLVFTFKEVGEEVKIVESVEYVDGAAVKVIGEALAKART